MENTNQQPEDEFTLDQAIELAESANDEHYTPWETFNDEIDTWARHALAANGFGDY